MTTRPDMRIPSSSPADSQRPDAIVFDCGNTMVTVDRVAFDAVFRAQGFSETECQRLEATFPVAGDLQLLEVPGVTSMRPFYDWWAFAAGVDQATAPNRIEKALQSGTIFSTSNTSLRPLFQELASLGVLIAVVANDDGELPQELVDLEVADLVSVAISSHEVGIRKPAPSIYQVASEALGVPASASWFVGDSLMNDVLGPQLAGFARSILFDPRRTRRLVPVERIEDLDELADMVRGRPSRTGRVEPGDYLLP